MFLEKMPESLYHCLHSTAWGMVFLGCSWLALLAFSPQILVKDLQWTGSCPLWINGTHMSTPWGIYRIGFKDLDCGVCFHDLGFEFWCTLDSLFFWDSTLRSSLERNKSRYFSIFYLICSDIPRTSVCSSKIQSNLVWNTLAWPTCPGMLVTRDIVRPIA
jgi:hypothetical protein